MRQTDLYPPEPDPYSDISSNIYQTGPFSTVVVASCRKLVDKFRHQLEAGFHLRLSQFITIRKTHLYRNPSQFPTISDRNKMWFSFTTLIHHFLRILSRLQPPKTLIYREILFQILFFYQTHSKTTHQQTEYYAANNPLSPTTQLSAESPPSQILRRFSYLLQIFATKSLKIVPCMALNFTFMYPSPNCVSCFYTEIGNGLTIHTFQKLR